MRPRLRDHVPSRPTWRCQACGTAWPCSPAKLRLLAEYRGNMPGLMVHLVALREEAAAQLADLHPGGYPANLHKRFTDWIPACSRQVAPASTPSPADAETAVAHAVANAALAGVEFDEDWQKNLRDVASGVIDADELINQEITRIRSDRDT